MAEGKKRRRRAYLTDFRAEVGGGYVYTGPLYHFQPGRLSRGRALALLWGLTALMALCAVGAGCIDAAGMGDCWYVIAPWAATLISMASVVWLMCRLSAGGDPLRGYVYTATVERFAPRSALVVGFSACAVLGELIFLLRNGAQGRQGGTALFLVCMVLAMGSAALWRRVTKGLKWSK